MTTVASYLPLNTGSTEREAETTVASIRSTFFYVSNLQVVGFADASRKPIKVQDTDQYPADHIYFNFCSIVSIATVNNRAPNK